jgi:hypothetical protein
MLSVWCKTPSTARLRIIAAGRASRARNEADQAIYQVEKSLGERVSSPVRAKLEAQVNTLKETMPGEDPGQHSRADR